MAPDSNTLAWKITCIEEPGRLQSMGSLRVGQTERINFHFSLSCFGEGNGNPLQYSCLENPKDGGAWSMGSHRVRHEWRDLAAVAAAITPSCPTLCDPMDSSLPSSSVHGHSPGKNIGVGCPFSPPIDPPYPVIKPRSPALQADFLLTEPSGSLFKQKYSPFSTLNHWLLKNIFFLSMIIIFIIYTILVSLNFHFYLTAFFHTWSALRNTYAIILRFYKIYSQITFSLNIELSRSKASTH